MSDQGVGDVLVIGSGAGSTSVGPLGLHVATHGASERRHEEVLLFVYGAEYFQIRGLGHMFPIESGWERAAAVLERWLRKTFPA